MLTPQLSSLAVIKMSSMRSRTVIMESASTDLLAAMQQALDGQQAGSGCWDRYGTRLAELNCIEKAAWLMLRNWDEDAEIRGESPSCDADSRRRMAELMRRMKENLGRPALPDRTIRKQAGKHETVRS